MSSEPSRDLIEKRYTVIADLGRGDTAETVASYLVNEGWTEDEAVAFVTTIRDEQAAGRPVVERAPPTDEELNDHDIKRRAQRNMTIGGFLLAGGAFVTLISYSVADVTGSYIVAYGALLWGGARLYIGHSALRRLEKKTASHKTPHPAQPS